MKKLFILLMIVTFTAGMAAAGHALTFNLKGTYTGTGLAIHANPAIPPTGIAIQPITTMTVNITWQNLPTVVAGGDGTLFCGNITLTGPTKTETETFTGKITGDDDIKLTVFSNTGVVNMIVSGKLETITYTIKGTFQSLTTGETGGFTVKKP